MTATFLVGDVFDRLAEIPDSTVDLVVTSPPFLALRSYLPADHPDKAKEIGSEATPAEFLDVMLSLTAEWGRVIAPHGSIAVELGDTYAGSGGGGGDYQADGLRSGQPVFDGSGRRVRETRREGYIVNGVEPPHRRDISAGWPLDKSLCGIPTLYAWSLAYGRNILTGQDSPAGKWRIRNVKPWIRSNPPVGALGDKERPATSYVVVATRAHDRYFDLDAVRTAPANGRSPDEPMSSSAYTGHPAEAGIRSRPDRVANAAGAPPRDWWHHVDAVLDACLDDMAGKVQRGGNTQPGADITPGRLGDGDGNNGKGRVAEGALTVGARGVHLRRALERAGILRTLEAVDVSPKGYSGSHYAVFPKELVRLLIDEMCPRRVCTTCVQPSRRITETSETSRIGGNNTKGTDTRSHRFENRTTTTTTTGWTTCGCPGTDGHREDGFHRGDGWRPGKVLDPFAGSGTTLAVASGMGRDSIGIDLDARNADLVRQRVGMFLHVEEPARG